MQAFGCSLLLRRDSATRDHVGSLYAGGVVNGWYSDAVRWVGPMPLCAECGVRVDDVTVDVETTSQQPRVAVRVTSWRVKVVPCGHSIVVAL